MSSEAQGAAKPAVTVFRGWDDRGKHVWSPFVTKLELRLRHAGLRHEVGVGSTTSGPKGKIPYVELETAPEGAAAAAAGGGGKERAGGPRTQIGDTTLIIRELAERGLVPDLNGGLAGDRRAQDLALRALLEEKLYFYHSWERWIQNYYTMRDHSLWALPYPVRVVVGLLVHRSIGATLHGQGTGRHEAGEIARFRREIWESLGALLQQAAADASKQQQQKRTSGDDDPFWVLGGDEPTEADFTLYGFIVSVLICTASPESQKVVRSFPILLEYAGRIHDRYFPDYEKWSP